MLIEDWYGSCRPITEICIGIKMASMLFVSFWQSSTVSTVIIIELDLFNVD